MPVLRDRRAGLFAVGFFCFAASCNLLKESAQTENMRIPAGTEAIKEDSPPDTEIKALKLAKAENKSPKAKEQQNVKKPEKSPPPQPGPKAKERQNVKKPEKSPPPPLLPAKEDTKKSPGVADQPEPAGPPALESPVSDEDLTASKKWGLNMSHAVSLKAAVGSRAVLSNSLSGRYKYSKKFVFSIGTAYSLPLGYVSDTSPYGLTDTSLATSFPLNWPKSFLSKKWTGGLGVSLPTSYQARKAGKWFSLFGRANHSLLKTNSFSLSGSHTLYTGFAKYISDISGFHPNSLISSIHSLNFTYKYKRISFAALGRIYVSLSLRREADISRWERIRWRGNQGLNFSLSYTHPQPYVSLFGQTGLNVPFISPVLTGSPFANQYWSYLAGLSWKI